MSRRGAPVAAAIAAAVVGLLFAAWLYGSRALNPSSAAWLMQGDPAQHYVGSTFFLAEPWHWPPGRINRFGEEPTSVVFTDAIPVMAMLSKLLSVSPGLQYFGLWMALCHALSGVFGALLLRRLGVRPGFHLALGAIFFIAAPAMLMRAYGHEALMAHWLVIAALVRALAPWRWSPWLLLGGLSVWVHPYLALMVCTLGAASGLAAMSLRELPWPRALVQGAASLALFASMAYLAGAFVGSGDVSAAGHGFYSANALTWFDPMNWREFMRFDAELQAQSREWSRWLPGLQQATGGQYEGFAYLGAGVLLAALLALAGRLFPRWSRETPAAAIPVARWVAVSIAAALLALWALSARPSIGPWILAEIPLGPRAEKIAGVFRASGRLIWPATYLVMALALAGLARLRWAAPLMAACLLLQASDLHGKFREFRERFRTGPPHVEPLVRDPVWSRALQRCPHLELVAGPASGGRWTAAAHAAALNGARFYPAPTARHSQEAAAARQRDVERLLATGSWRNDVVYVLSAPLPAGKTVEGVASSLPAGLRHVRADGYDLLVPDACR